MPGSFVQPLFKVVPNHTGMSNACQVFVDVYYVQTMYNIKQAAARAGVTVPVLRAWERRYGIVAPARSAGGYRQFDDASVARVRVMRGLVDDGWSPSAAASAILSGDVPVPPGEATRTPGTRSKPTPGSIEVATEADPATVLSRRFVEAARTMAPEAVDAVLDDLFARGSFERVVTDLLFPALEELGEAWAREDVSVAGEHLASGAVLRRLGLALEAAGSIDGRGPRVLVGLPPGGRHELGALAFAVAARRAGLSVAYLGPDLPVEDWVRAAGDAGAAVIGVVVARDRAAAGEVARRLHETYPALVIAFGGPAAPSAPDATRLPRRLADSVTALQEAMRAA